jgi:phosphoribosylglycinamide formyltransferase-1
MAAEYGLPVLVLEKSMPAEEQTRRILTAFERHQIDLVALAGYLRRIEPDIINAVHGHVLNIHPSLLPKHGGRGMYGAAVHRAVLESGDAESGATVHMVNARYDEGQVLAQERVPVQLTDTVDDLAKRVLDVEHRLYPVAIAAYIRTGST